MTGEITHFLENCQKKIAKKCQIVNIKYKLESPKQLHRTTFETLKCPWQTIIETDYLGYNGKHLLW